MKIDFFKNNCSEPSRNNEIFGICDEDNQPVAFSDESNQEKWIAKVKNLDKKDIVFTPIDNCILIFKKDSEDRESTCDGMLTFDNSIYLVELKKVRVNWFSDAVEQLKNTIKLLNENHIIDIKYKKAFVCNKKHPSFTVIKSELSKKFFKETDGFRIDAQAEIIIK